ncbi:Putative uncharacterized protein [Lactobacillus equicursoris 66c]|uniref:Uncharacterized protein n=1 Tax=Lactobacillus equicursoris 66c TaxID=872326 RepID=K0ND94_9LACO|nr:hypothetical protein [Lactobacillus equicursoris]MDD6385646.1 hypothetical protein [Lactobacillus equicursoris]CCK82712.1 Putative uncharacterized protein [Lactobacillus equicursoris 66c]
MQLTDFMQLLTSLDDRNALFLAAGDQEIPLSKVTLARESCQLTTGDKPLTLGHLKRLLGRGSQDIPLRFLADGQEVPVYGVQIQAAKGRLLCK